MKYFFDLSYTQSFLIFLFAMYVRLNIIFKVKMYRMEVKLFARKQDNYLDFLSDNLIWVSAIIPIFSSFILYHIISK